MKTKLPSLEFFGTVCSEQPAYSSFKYFQLYYSAVRIKNCHFKKTNAFLICKNYIRLKRAAAS